MWAFESCKIFPISHPLDHDGHETSDGLEDSKKQDHGQEPPRSAVYWIGSSRSTWPWMVENEWRRLLKKQFNSKWPSGFYQFRKPGKCCPFFFQRIRMSLKELIASPSRLDTPELARVPKNYSRNHAEVFMNDYFLEPTTKIEQTYYQCFQMICPWTSLNKLGLPTHPL